MRKIPTLFVRDEADRRYVTREVKPGCEWVLAGEGTPTRKYDGTAVMFDGSAWWARREVKPGKATPPNFAPVETDEVTGKTVGWEPLDQSSFARWHAEAVAAAGAPGVPWTPGTYELIGAKVNGNPEGVGEMAAGSHLLVFHDHQVRAAAAMAEVLTDVPRDFDGLAKWLPAQPWEGVVWQHEDGRMAKLKKRDFPSS